jgi:hypothetical protein
MTVDGAAPAAANSETAAAETSVNADAVIAAAPRRIALRFAWRGTR